jgi:hypothetical protein
VTYSDVIQRIKRPRQRIADANAVDMDWLARLAWLVCVIALFAASIAVAGEAVPVRGACVLLP